MEGMEDSVITRSYMEGINGLNSKLDIPLLNPGRY